MMDAAQAFFCGFVAAQFISGWISGPVIFITIVCYVFLGKGVQRLIQSSMPYLPTFLVNSALGHLLPGHGTQPAKEDDLWAGRIETPSSPFGPPMRV